MRGRAVRVVLAMLAAMGVATSCGGDKPSAVVEVAAVWSAGEQTQFTRVLSRFTAEDGADVRYTPVPSDTFMQNLLDRVENGRPPDVAILPQSGLLRELARIKAVQPIEDVAGTLVDRNYAPLWRELGSVRGTLYGVWFKTAHKSLVWYRPDGLEKAGLTPPRSWAELQAVAPKLVKPGSSTALAVGGGDGWVLTDWFENVYLRTAGPEKYDQLACHQIPWTDASVKNALATLGQVLGQSDWIAGGTLGALGTTFPKSVEQVFADPSSATMLAGGDFVAGTLPRGKRVGVDAKFFDFPSIEGSPPAVVAGGDVAVLLRPSEAGRRLMRYLATPQAAEPWARAGGFISPNRALDLAVYPTDAALVVARSLRESEVVRYDLSDQQPASFGGAGGQGLWKILQDYLRNPADVDGITGRLEEGANVSGARCPIN